MARTGRPKAELQLSTEERLVLERLANRRKSAQAMAMRARIVMCCAKGDTNREVAGRLGVSEAMVGKWRRRFVEHGLDGLSDDPRPGAPRTVTDGQVEAVVVKTLEGEPLLGAQHQLGFRSSSASHGCLPSLLTMGRTRPATRKFPVPQEFSRTSGSGH